MANEATLLTQIGLPVNFTCADGTGIEKGAILTMTDYMTATLCAADDDIVAGFCASEKIADNGTTHVSVHREGIFKVKLSGSATVGDPLVTQAAVTSNAVAAGLVALSGSKIIGTALESGTTGHTIRMELKPQCGGY